MPFITTTAMGVMWGEWEVPPHLEVECAVEAIRMQVVVVVVVVAAALPCRREYFWAPSMPRCAGILM